MVKLELTSGDRCFFTQLHFNIKAFVFLFIYILKINIKDLILGNCLSRSTLFRFFRYCFDRFGTFYHLCCTFCFFRQQFIFCRTDRDGFNFNIIRIGNRFCDSSSAIISNRNYTGLPIRHNDGQSLFGEVNYRTNQTFIILCEFNLQNIRIVRCDFLNVLEEQIHFLFIDHSDLNKYISERYHIIGRQMIYKRILRDPILIGFCTRKHKVSKLICMEPDTGSYRAIRISGRFNIAIDFFCIITADIEQPVSFTLHRFREYNGYIISAANTFIGIHGETVVFRIKHIVLCYCIDRSIVQIEICVNIYPVTEMLSASGSNCRRTRLSTICYNRTDRGLAAVSNGDIGNRFLGFKRNCLFRIKMIFCNKGIVIPVFDQCENINITNFNRFNTVEVCIYIGITQKTRFNQNLSE